MDPSAHGPCRTGSGLLHAEPCDFMRAGANFAAVVLVGLTLSSLAYRHLTNTSYYSFSEDGQQQRMTNQHAVVHYAASASYGTPPLVHNDPPPPPPPLDAAAATVAMAEKIIPVEKPAAAASSVPTAEWMDPEHNFLAFNEHAKRELTPVTPKGTTLHFTFGSGVMMDFVKNCACRTLPPIFSLFS